MYLHHIVYHSTLDTLSLLPPTAPCVICCGSVGTFTADWGLSRGSLYCLSEQWARRLMLLWTQEVSPASHPLCLRNFPQYMSISLPFFFHSFPRGFVCPRWSGHSSFWLARWWLGWSWRDQRAGVYGWSNACYLISAAVVESSAARLIRWTNSWDH